MPDAGRPWMHGAPMYALVSLALIGVAAPLSGSRERALGMAVAWAIQVAAFWPLDRALASGRDATRAWLSGIALRVGGLVVLGVITFAGPATRALPVAYGISMVVLLLAEAAWLARGLGRRGGGTKADPDDQLDGTRKTG